MNGKLVALDPLSKRIAVRIVGTEDDEGLVIFHQGNAVHFDTCTKQRATQRTRV